MRFRRLYTQSMSKFVSIIAGCALAGCTVSNGRLGASDGELITPAEQQAAFSLLTALYRPDQFHRVMIDATPVEHFDRNSTRQLEKRLRHLRAGASAFQVSLETEQSSPHSVPSRYFKANYFPSSGRFQELSASASQPGKDLEITVRLQRDGTLMFDCLWLTTRQEDFFRLSRGMKVFQFFNTGENSA
jgi:hypothetical protein